MGPVPPSPHNDRSPPPSRKTHDRDDAQPPGWQSSPDWSEVGSFLVRTLAVCALARARFGSLPATELQ